MNFDNIQKTNININRIVDNPKYTMQIPDKLDINDTILAYNNGRVWKIVSLHIVLSHPIIYDTHYDDNIASDISVTYCPYTSCGIVYFGKYKLTNKVYNSNIIIKNNDGYMAQMLGILYSKQNKIMPGIIRKDEVRIMTLKNALTRYPDCQFLHFNSNMVPLITNSYLNNNNIMFKTSDTSKRFHPKTLIYGIEYINGTQKYSAIIGYDSSNTKANSRDYNENKFNVYLVKMLDDIRERHGIVYPVYWFAWYAMYPTTKVIKV